MDVEQDLCTNNKTEIAYEPLPTITELEFLNINKEINSMMGEISEELGNYDILLNNPNCQSQSQINNKENSSLVNNNIGNNQNLNNENLLDIHYDNYDFGSDNTGDITKYENLQYYRNNHNDYDLITVGCGTQRSDSGFKFLFSQYLMIFSCCKKSPDHGPAVIMNCPALKTPLPDSKPMTCRPFFIKLVILQSL